MTASNIVSSTTLWHHRARTDASPRTGIRGARRLGVHGVHVTNSASSCARAVVGVSNTARSTTNSTLHSQLSTTTSLVSDIPPATPYRSVVPKRSRPRVRPTATTSSPPASRTNRASPTASNCSTTRARDG